jgi:DGQHR domain-containing protein
MARIEVPAFELQGSPRILVAAIPGRWVLKHSTPSWRAKDPKKGFQRMVREERAKNIALTVLDNGRCFPNAIVLATDIPELTIHEGMLALPDTTKFLVVDGQHRLWAQSFSTFEATYASIIHLGLSEVQMATLFLEINDNQKRVPSSLRWDLVRLVRPQDDPHALAAVELVYGLATTESSPLYQRIDLTGEQGEIDIKQGSLAPELKSLVAARSSDFSKLDFEGQYEALAAFLSAVKQVDPNGWRKGNSPLAKARVLRALLRLLPQVAKKIGKPADAISGSTYLKILSRIKIDSLSAERIKAVQGSAGIREISAIIARQIGVRPRP